MKKSETVLITGACGLVGSACVEYFSSRVGKIVGIDNDQRGRFFGAEGSVRAVGRALVETYENFELHDLDVRNEAKIGEIVQASAPDLVIHCAAQPSHEFSASHVLEDFSINAGATTILLEHVRKCAPEAVFAFLSSNKVYGDLPNRIAMKELPTRWDFADPQFASGIAEDLAIDGSMHTPYGASKASADLMVQEYGRYFGMPTVCLRAGCITGAKHEGVAMHGFLSYLVRTALEGRVYGVHGYKGKQVRDQIHALDVASAIDAFSDNPRTGAVYNLGGGRENSVSILEAIEMISTRTGRRMSVEFLERARMADHICYYTDLRKFRGDHPKWRPEYDLARIMDDLLSPNAAR